ncbi:28926_t:CDS:10, partial [Gigaspora margarita]
LRDLYQDKICEIFENFKEIEMNINPKTFKEMVQEEQKDFMKHMMKPEMVAENFALLENVLVITVCILTRIPLASKSLAVRLVSQSLRGNDSDDPYFRTLPQVYLVPHQGSSSIKHAITRKEIRRNFHLITVVLLDEILHSLLEPNYPAELPEVAIIGISNWRLDNSKSSRTLLVQRPNLEIQDLIYTTSLLLGESIESQFKTLAESYLEYKKTQSINNFHGLRYYYSLVKSLGNSEFAPLALARNFGGTNQMDELYKTHFSKVIKAFHGFVDNFNNYSIEHLIKANLKDKNACYLMIIGKSNSIINILTYKLKQWNKELVDKDSKSNDANFDLEPIIIYSSQFPDDFGDDYQYSVLIRIMMCVEMGRPLILTDLDKIYGSLYDLWNQNYIIVGKNGDQTFYTRIALGAYSNPLVCIHKNFRCILVLDEKDVDLSNLPLLNRFEKQKMTINDMIDNSKTRLLNELVKWSIRISTLLNIEGEATSKFNESDMFIGFDKEETLQTLPDVNVRSKNAILKDATKSQGFNVIVYTFSNISTDIESSLNNILKCQIDKLSTFKSEEQFRSRIKNFWLESEDDILILQCDFDAANSECIKHAKFIIEQYKNEFMENKCSTIQVKHVCIILHLKKENTTSTISLFNFMCGWDLFTIETLIPQEYPLLANLDKDMINVLETEYTFEKVIDHELLWCLLCMEFPPSCESADYIASFAQKIPRHKEFMNWMKPEHLDGYMTINSKIAQLLFALEKLSGLLILDSDSLFEKEDKNENEDSHEDNNIESNLFSFWEPIIMNTKVVNC